jgi:uncharacterized protein YdaU (DUF1376 family)
MSGPLRQWLPLDIAEFHDVEAELPSTALAAYIRFIVRAWKNGGALPADPAKLSRIARCPESVWRHALATFELVREGWVHPGLKAQLVRANETASTKRRAANARWEPAKTLGANVIKLTDEKQPK